MRAAQISLIISTYERPAPLDQVLQGLQRQSEMPLEIIIADDGSGPATRELIGQWQQRLATPLRHLWQPNLGFRKTLILNQSVAAAKGDYIVLLDGDCVPHAKFIADHAALAEKNSWVQGRRCFVEEKFAPAFSAAATPVCRWMLAGRITGLAKAVRLPFPVVCRNTGQRGIIGCNMGIWREDLLAINGFDEEYTGWGIGEDSDLGTRLYHLGRPRKFVYGHAIVYHLNHPMLGRSHLPASRQRLAETIRSGKIRCQRGIEQYLSNAAQPVCNAPALDGRARTPCAPRRAEIPHRNFSHCTPEPVAGVLKNSHSFQGTVYQYVATFILGEAHGEDCPPSLPSA